MDFELMRRKKVAKFIEIVIILAFVIFTFYEIFTYVSELKAKERTRQQEVDEMLDHPFEVSADDAKALESLKTTYEGEHPYSSVDLPYSLASLSIETEDGKAVYTNGKAAGVNLDVKEILDGDTVTAVDLSPLGCELINLSGTGNAPVINVRYSEGYSVRVTLDHAIQASLNRDGDLNVYNLQQGDKFDITYIINADSYKYPGVTRFTLTGTADGDGIISVILRGKILNVSGIRFKDTMLSAEEGAGGSGYGMPLDGENAFVTYNFETMKADSTPQKKE